MHAVGTCKHLPEQVAKHVPIRKLSHKLENMMNNRLLNYWPNLDHCTDAQNCLQENKVCCNDQHKRKWDDDALISKDDQWSKERFTTSAVEGRERPTDGVVTRALAFAKIKPLQCAVQVNLSKCNQLICNATQLACSLILDEFRDLITTFCLLHYFPLFSENTLRQNIFRHSYYNLLYFKNQYLLDCK